MKFAEYLTYASTHLLERLCEISEELASVYTELGYTRAEEFSKRHDRWLDSREPSVTGRENDVKYSAATETISLIELEAREKSLIEEKHLILRLLEHADAT